MENTPEDEVKLVSIEMVRIVRLSVPVETVNRGIVVYVNPAEQKMGYISFMYVETVLVIVPTAIVVVSSWCFGPMRRIQGVSDVARVV